MISTRRLAAATVLLAMAVQGAPASAQREIVQPLPGAGEQKLSDALSRLARNSQDVTALLDAGEAAGTRRHRCGDRLFRPCERIVARQSAHQRRSGARLYALAPPDRSAAPVRRGRAGGGARYADGAGSRPGLRSRRRCGQRAAALPSGTGQWCGRGNSAAAGAQARRSRATVKRSKPRFCRCFVRRCPRVPHARFRTCGARRCGRGEGYRQHRAAGRAWRADGRLSRLRAPPDRARSRPPRAISACSRTSSIGTDEAAPSPPMHRARRSWPRRHRRRHRTGQLPQVQGPKLRLRHAVNRCATGCGQYASRAGRSAAAGHGRRRSCRRRPPRSPGPDIEPCSGPRDRRRRSQRLAHGRRPRRGRPTRRQAPDSRCRAGRPRTRTIRPARAHCYRARRSDGIRAAGGHGNRLSVTGFGHRQRGRSGGHRSRMPSTASRSRRRLRLRLRPARSTSRASPSRAKRSGPSRHRPPAHPARHWVQVATGKDAPHSSSTGAA